VTLEWGHQTIEKLKVGVIGLGKVAQIIHLPILEDQTDRYKICALCDVSPNLLGLIGERLESEYRPLW
jgi:predicted dehydrogenase